MLTKGLKWAPDKCAEAYTMPVNIRPEAIALNAGIGETLHMQTVVQNKNDPRNSAKPRLSISL